MRGGGVSQLLACLAAVRVGVAHGISVVGHSGAPPAEPPGSGPQDYFLPQFFAPQLTPPEFLLISSATENKVVYTEMRNFKSKTGRTWALVDSGLQSPRSIAFDRQRGYLYVADKGAGRIYRYRVLVKKAASGSDGLNSYSLVTDGVQITIRRVPDVEWVAVDVTGAVFYSDPGSQSIFKIPGAVAEAIGNGDYSADYLQVMSETDLEALLFRQAQESLQPTGSEDGSQSAGAQPCWALSDSPRAYELYQASSTASGGAPKGVVSDGVRLYWATASAGSGGSVVLGEASPRLPLDRPSSATLPRFPASVLANSVATPYGVAKSNTMTFFSTNVTGSGTVYGIAESGDLHALAQGGLVEPRGLVWDGDQTVYVADQASHNVWSFPAGRIMDGAPLTRSVAVTGAFGVALFSASDVAFQKQAGAHRLSATAPLLLALGAAWLGR